MERERRNSFPKTCSSNLLDLGVIKRVAPQKRGHDPARVFGNRKSLGQLGKTTR